MYRGSGAGSRSVVCQDQPTRPHHRQELLKIIRIPWLVRIQEQYIDRCSIRRCMHVNRLVRIALDDRNQIRNARRLVVLALSLTATDPLHGSTGVRPSP